VWSLEFNSHPAPGVWSILSHCWMWMYIEMLASKFPDAVGTYRRLSHTDQSCIVSCVRISDKMFDVGNLPLPTFGNWVQCTKSSVTKCPVKLYVFFFTCFTVFFKIPEQHNFLRFFGVAAHVFSNNVFCVCARFSSGFWLENITRWTFRQSRFIFSRLTNDTCQDTRIRHLIIVHCTVLASEWISTLL